MEDYLEAIYDLDKDQKVVRVRDIAKKMDVKMPSVTSMLKALNERNLVHYEKYAHVELTVTDFMEFIQTCPRGSDRLKLFEEYRSQKIEKKESDAHSNA